MVTRIIPALVENIDIYRNAKVYKCRHPYNSMFIEIRESGKKKKYYLVHSYRSGTKIKRLTRYLGSDLKEKDIEKLKARAETLILEQMQGKNPLEFELSEEELKEYKKFEIEIHHLQQKVDWDLFTEEFAYNTNAIEGSTVPYLEAKGLIEEKIVPESSEEIETVNVGEAVEYIRDSKEELSLDLIKKLHKVCFNKTKSFAGEFRDVEVVVKNRKREIIHRGVPAVIVKKLLSELIEWYNQHKSKYPPLMLAALVHNQFENIHPFKDGNGRVGRLLLNYVLLKHKYPPLNIRVSERERYYDVLLIFERTGDIKPTLRFLLSQYRK